MSRIVAIYGSPRREGNTARLLDRAVSGAREAGAEVRVHRLRDLKISPCLEIYGCRKEGICAIKDDFHAILADILDSRGLMLASPIFFYGFTAHTKALIDRCQSLWVKKYWIDKVPFGQGPIRRQGLLISAGATQGKRLFEGALLTIRYFFDTLDMALWRSLLYRGLDDPQDVLGHPEFLEEATAAGRAFALDLDAKDLKHAEV